MKDFCLKSFVYQQNKAQMKTKKLSTILLIILLIFNANFSEAISPFNNDKLTVREMKNIFGNDRKTKLKSAEEPVKKIIPNQISDIRLTKINMKPPIMT